MFYTILCGENTHYFFSLQQFSFLFEDFRKKIDQTKNVFHSRFCRLLKKPKRPVITEGTVPEFLGKPPPPTVVRQVTGSIAAHPGTHLIAYPSYNRVFL